MLSAAAASPRSELSHSQKSHHFDFEPAFPYHTTVDFWGRSLKHYHTIINQKSHYYASHAALGNSRGARAIKAFWHKVNHCVEVSWPYSTTSRWEAARLNFWALCFVCTAGLAKTGIRRLTWKACGKKFLNRGSGVSPWVTALARPHTRGWFNGSDSASFPPFSCALV